MKSKAQVDNLIQFCFLFHPSFDCDWTKQSPDYIKEKWNKYIGVDVTSTDFDKSYFTHNTIQWLKTWNVSNDDWSELKRVIRFIISLSEKPMLVGRMGSQYKRIWTLSEIIENFENQISPVTNITVNSYNNVHVLVKKEIEAWLSDTQNNREYNLSLLL
jgi:hypothetical protein